VIGLHLSDEAMVLRDAQILVVASRRSDWG
jgi:hypothetical protein